MLTLPSLWVNNQLGFICQDVLALLATGCACWVGAPNLGSFLKNHLHYNCALDNFAAVWIVTSGLLPAPVEDVIAVFFFVSLSGRGMFCQTHP